MKISQLYYLLATAVTLAACNPERPAHFAEEEGKLSDFPRYELDAAWNDYWHAGVAELSYYDLSQSRYGESRDGEAVMIFVTEDFSRNKQVKLDDPEGAGEDRLTVLKLNFLRKFTTGLYDYSIMQSVFSPSGSSEPALKATCSVQDWCGQAFSQVNRRIDGYQYRSFSYFESEGDADGKWSDAVLEDDLWTKLRMSPASLAGESVPMVPSMAFLRLSHIEARPYTAALAVDMSADTATLQLQYRDIDRSLEIRFAKDFPHEIFSWREKGSFGPADKVRVYDTRAVLNKRINSPYWQHNRLSDSTLRQNFTGS